MKKRALFLVVLAASLFGGGCTADLADGNPCRSVAHSVCQRWLDCNLLPEGDTADDCVERSSDTVLEDCNFDIDYARECGTAVRDAACDNPVPPSACGSLFSLDPLSGQPLGKNGIYVPWGHTGPVP